MSLEDQAMGLVEPAMEEAFIKMFQDLELRSEIKRLLRERAKNNPLLLIMMEEVSDEEWIYTLMHSLVWTRMCNQAIRRIKEYSEEMDRDVTADEWAIMMGGYAKRAFTSMVNRLSSILNEETDMGDQLEAMLDAQV